MTRQRIEASAMALEGLGIGSRAGRRWVVASVRSALLVAAGVIAAGAGVACQDPECEASRLELARTWQTLRDTATSRKQIPEGADLSQAQEQDRIRIWTAVEAHAELVRSSFETSQVTWSSAEKARAELNEAIKPLASNEDPMTRGFALTLSEADRRMAEFKKTCR
jgi:leucyl aminopeptidase (aminopeptidase T)